ncbi:MAG TPA: FMN-binding protein [Bacteroidales bacterium]|nr:FMN-binding protein [Bacteroidales bacterium]
MKSIKLCSAFLFAALIFFVPAGAQSLSGNKTVYRDGTYVGESRAAYTGEPYWGKVQVTISNGQVTDVKYTVRDSSLHETFNIDYAKHFAGNEAYIQQTKNDWNGVQTYPKRFLESQDTNKIDVVSGATWSYNIFRAALGEALKKASAK